MNVWKENGISLTTYNFRSASGIQYQYSLEFLDNYWNPFHYFNNKDSNKDKQTVTSRRKRWLEKIKNNAKPLETTNEDAVKMLMEISSAQNFTLKSTHFSSLSESTLFIVYNVVLDCVEEKGEHNNQRSYKVLHSGQTQHSRSSQNRSKYSLLCFNCPKLLIILLLEMVIYVALLHDSL